MFISVIYDIGLHFFFYFLMDIKMEISEQTWMQIYIQYIDNEHRDHSDHTNTQAGLCLYLLVFSDYTILQTKNKTICQ